MNLNKKEMQIALTRWGRELFAKKMGIRPSEMAEFCRTNGLSSPTQHLRTQANADLTSFLKTIIRFSDVTTAAEKFGVSTATLNKVLDEVGVPTGYKVLDDFTAADVADIKDTANRTGSMTLTADVYDTTQATIEQVVERKEVSDPIKQGYRAKSGRIGELAAKQYLELNSQILQDCHWKYTQQMGFEPTSMEIVDTNSTKGFNNKGVDFELHIKSPTGNTMILTAQVKSVKPYKVRARSKRGLAWSFGWEKTADIMIWVCLDADGNAALKVGHFTVDRIPDHHWVDGKIRKRFTLLDKHVKQNPNHPHVLIHETAIKG